MAQASSAPPGTATRPTATFRTNVSCRRRRRSGHRDRRSVGFPPPRGSQYETIHDGSATTGKIVISENVSLDGVMQDPTGEEGFRLGGWFTQVGDRDHAAWAAVRQDEAVGAEAMLMGRRSDEWFAERWLSRTGEWAERLNSLPKYVVSSTIETPRWTTSTNSTVLRGDVVGEVSQLKGEIDGEIVVFDSTQLV